MIDVLEVKRWTGMRHEFDRYYYINQIPLRDGDKALQVNWCELFTTDAHGKVLYHNAFVTDRIINRNNVAAVVQDGRA